MISKRILLSNFDFDAHDLVQACEKFQRQSGMLIRNEIPLQISMDVEVWAFGKYVC